MQWWMFILILGFSFALWLTVGGLRLAGERVARPRPTALGESSLSAKDVAVLIPAHNEELGIGATLDSVLRLVPAAHVHVIADGCDDRTGSIARSRGVHVFEQWPNRGKAGGIQLGIERFGIADRFELVLLLDSDTRLDEHYLVRGLRLMEDPEITALAGYAHTEWLPATLTPVGRVLLSYRARLYAVMQWVKYGQTWRHTNVTPIVPGFASIYRTRALAHMDLDPPGLVIEDFNMTFELHHRGLGKIAFEPSVFGISQDPDNVPDYYRQISRWWLGLWQTVRRHGLWLSWFSAALVLFLAETVIASVVLLLVALSVVFLAMDPLTGGLALQWEWYAAVHGWLAPVVTPTNLLLFVFLPDYVLTCAAAAWLRRPSLLVYGLGFLFVRCVDSLVTMRTLVRMWLVHSNGRWTSPARRPAVVAARPGNGSGSGEARASTVENRSPAGTTRTRERHPPARRHREATPVVVDAVHAVTLVVLASALVVVAVPVTVTLLGLVALATIGVVQDSRSFRRKPARPRHTLTRHALRRPRGRKKHEESGRYVEGRDDR